MLVNNQPEVPGASSSMPARMPPIVGKLNMMLHVSGVHGSVQPTCPNTSASMSAADPPVATSGACTAAAASISLSIAFILFDSSLFGWHPLFMSVGFLLFMTEGLVGAGTLWERDREAWVVSHSGGQLMFSGVSAQHNRKQAINQCLLDWDWSAAMQTPALVNNADAALLPGATTAHKLHDKAHH